MYNLNLNFIPKNFNGKNVGEETIARILANAMAFSKSQDPLKIFNIATELYKNGEINIDSSDLNLIKSFVESNQDFLNILKAQILAALNKVQLENKN